MQTHEVFDDGEHLIYLNGQYRGDDDLGKLMHDISCTDAGEMYLAPLAELTQYLKETLEGLREMSNWLDQARAAGKLEE